MKRPGANIVSALSHRTASLLVMTLCILVKSLLIAFYSFVGRDKILHLAATHNLLQGKGWTNSIYYVENINAETLQPFCYWPPGYGVLLTPFHLVFGNNIYWSTTSLEIIAFVFFLVLCRGIMRQLEFSMGRINAFTLIIGLFPYDFIENSLGTDLPALCLLLAFLYFILRAWREHHKLFLAILAGVFLAAAGFMRYPYVPVGFLIAILIPASSYWLRRSAPRKNLWIFCISTVVGLVVVLLIQNAICGNSFYVKDSGQGFFPENLSYWHPAALAAFTNLPVLAGNLQKLTGIAYMDWFQIFNLLNLVVYAVLTIAAVVWFNRRQQDRYYFFRFTGISLSILIIGELLLLSLFRGRIVYPNGNSWTFIAEGRYHAFVIVFIQLLFFASLVIATYRRLKYFLMILLLVTIIHQFYFAAKLGLNFTPMKSNVEREQDYVYFERLMTDVSRKEPGMEILVASSDEFYRGLAAIHNRKGIANPLMLAQHIPEMNKPAILFTIVLQSEQSSFEPYLARESVKLVKDFGSSAIYMEELQPK